jgi:uncharacterized membrane protein (UPF0127 family)
MMRFLVLALVFLATPTLAKVTDAKPIIAHITTATGKAITLTLEPALTEKTREIGLMNRKNLAPHDGMVFFFPRVATQKFWMKNTVIPLDILFVDEAGRIVYIAKATPLSEEQVGPDSPIETVIEIAGGRAAKHGIAVGDKVTYAITGKPRAMAH